MLLVLARRLGNVVPTLLAVIALVFLLFSVLPGSFISGMNEDGRSPIDPAVMERMRKEMGLDDPLYERFAKYVANVATGDLGTSFRTREPVTKLIGPRVWPSLKLVFAAMAFAISVGVTAGVPGGPAARQPDRHGVDGRRRSRACRCRSSGSA